MRRAGLTDREMIDRLRRTDQIFQLSPSSRTTSATAASPAG